METCSSILKIERTLIIKCFTDHFYSFAGLDLKRAELLETRGPGYNHSEDRKISEKFNTIVKMELTENTWKIVFGGKKAECEIFVPENVKNSLYSEENPILRILKRALKVKVCTQSLTLFSLGLPPACLDYVATVTEAQKAHVVDHVLFPRAIADTGHTTGVTPDSIVTPDSSVRAWTTNCLFLLECDIEPGSPSDAKHHDCYEKRDCVQELTGGQGHSGAEIGAQANEHGEPQEAKLSDYLIGFHGRLKLTGNAITQSATSVVSSCGAMIMCEISINSECDLLTPTYLICDLLTPTRLHHTVCGCGVYRQHKIFI